MRQAGEGAVEGVDRGGDVGGRVGGRDEGAGVHQVHAFEQHGLAQRLGDGAAGEAEEVGGLAVASRPEAVADLQTRRSFGWQAMPLFRRLAALAKCGSFNGPAPAQFVFVLAIA